MAAPGAGGRRERCSAAVGGLEEPRAIRSSRLTYSSSRHIIREPSVARGQSSKSQEREEPEIERRAERPNDEADADDEGRSPRRRPIAPPQSAAVVRRANDLQYHDNSFNSIGAGRCAPAAPGAKSRSQVSAQVPDKRRGSGGGSGGGGGGGGNGRRAHSEQERLQQRSQGKQRTSNSNGNNNSSHHHYDHCTDPDLVSAQPHHSSSSANFRAENFNYDQNILLFATEHVATSGGPRPAALVAQNGHSTSNLSRAKPPSRGLQLGATGKFVSHYPTYASATQPSPNYSFHVPLRSAAGFRRHLQPAGPKPLSGGRSRTIAHLPLLDTDHSSSGADERPAADCDHLAGSHCYEDFYERPESGADARRLNCGQYLMLSEGDLLRVRQPTEDVENPFRPGTELSWEADLMVRLIQRGYPIQELPQLVAAAKEVAADEAQTARSGTLPPGAELRERPGAGPPERGKSACDLSLSGKRAWASSLQRAKSMPRVLRNRDSSLLSEDDDADDDDDDDSLDRLITSIEREISCSLAELKATTDDKVGQAKATTDRKRSREVIGPDDSSAKIRGAKMARKKKITAVATTSSKKKLADCCVVQ